MGGPLAEPRQSSDSVEATMTSPLLHQTVHQPPSSHHESISEDYGGDGKITEIQFSLLTAASRILAFSFTLATGIIFAVEGVRSVTPIIHMVFVFLAVAWHGLALFTYLLTSRFRVSVVVGGSEVLPLRDAAGRRRRDHVFWVDFAVTTAFFISTLLTALEWLEWRGHYVVALRISWTAVAFQILTTLLTLPALTKAAIRFETLPGPENAIRLPDDDARPAVKKSTSTIGWLLQSATMPPHPATPN